MQQCLLFHTGQHSEVLFVLHCPEHGKDRNSAQLKLFTKCQLYESTMPRKVDLSMDFTHNHNF
jgi:hypothetical protein